MSLFLELAFRFLFEFSYWEGRFERWLRRATRPRITIPIQRIGIEENEYQGEGSDHEQADRR